MYQEKEVNYNGRIYTVTSEGRIFRTGGKPKERHELKGGKETTGYLSTRIGGKAMRIHVLVATTFLIRPEGKMHVNHKNGIKLDNRLENLEWVTPKQNVRHAIENGLMNTRGTNHAHARIDFNIVKKIRELKQNGFTSPNIKYMLGLDIGERHIRDIINRKCWDYDVDPNLDKTLSGKSDLSI